MTTQHQDHQDLEPGLGDIPLTLENLPRLPFLAFIRFYQKVLSPGLPTGTCRFEPTCSHYGYQAIAKFGIIKGGAMAVWRILRCQPLNPGGYDPVP